MLTLRRSIRRRLPARKAGLTAALLLAGIAAACIASVACARSDNDDADGTPGAAGRIVTLADATATPTPTSPPAALGATLVPAASSTPTAAAGAVVPGQTSPGIAAMVDMAPCDGQAHYSVQTFAGGVPALTYVDVPVGTPILFPFEEGNLVQADARAGAIVLVYEVEGVGIFSVQAAGTETLDRLVGHPVAGTVIGHFGGTFGEEETDAFEGYQLFAVAGTQEMVKVGDQLYAGETLTPDVQDCLVLP